MKKNADTRTWEEKIISLIQKYTNDKFVIERVFSSLQEKYPHPDDPFTEYNILMIVILEEFRLLKDEQLYMKILNIYKQDLKETMINMTSTMKNLFRFLMVTGLMVMGLSFFVGYIFAIALTK
jgi:hypothetical protein